VQQTNAFFIHIIQRVIKIKHTDKATLRR